jgi:hypothetical protein
MAIPGESALAVEPKVRTTLPKVDKAKTSSVKSHMVLTLVTLSRSKTSDDTPFDDDPNLLNFAAVVFWTTCWMSCLLQRY